jgi:hypothetical protein
MAQRRLTEDCFNRVEQRRIPLARKAAQQYGTGRYCAVHGIGWRGQVIKEVYGMQFFRIEVLRIPLSRFNFIPTDTNGESHVQSRDTWS